MYVVCVLSPHTVRIAASIEASSVDYTGQIRQFSEIGVGGPSTNTPRPWVCYAVGFDLRNVVQWQTPDGSAVPTSTGSNEATSSELFQIFDWGQIALYRGPNYNSPDGEYCCVNTTVSGQKRCVTLSEYEIVIKVNFKK